MKLLSIQVALFPPTIIARPDLLMNTINEKTGNIFDAMPSIVNLPLEVPTDVPLAQVRSTNNELALNVSRGRIDLIITPKFDAIEPPVDVFKSYRTIIDKYCKTVLYETNLSRIGVILTLFKATTENTKSVFEKYLTETFLNGCIEACVKVNKQSLSKGFVYNNIRNVEAVDLHIGSDVQKGVVVQLDTNNVPDSSKILTADMIAYTLTQVMGKIKAAALKELI